MTLIGNYDTNSLQRRNKIMREASYSELVTRLKIVTKIVHNRIHIKTITGN